MKYGLLIHEPTTNIGDDIQSYAIKQFLPQVDYYVDRENIDRFASKDNEPVATVMGAWWMWKKFDWPPAECIIPKLISMHFNNYGIREKSSPVKNEWLQGIGKEYFKAYGPVGVRDYSSLEYLKKNDIEAYFSGCVTLTLPKQNETADKGSYVVIADLREELDEKVTRWLKDSGLEIRRVTHNCSYRKNPESMYFRFKRVEDILTLYQNAKFVITRRLHVTLPCLAMEVPVISVVDLDAEGNSTRWAPYHRWVNYISEKDILAGNISFDYNNPPENKKDYLPVRESLIKEISGFVNEMGALPHNTTVAEIKKTSFTEKEAREWQFDLMRDALDKWLYLNRKLLKDYKELKKKYKNETTENEQKENSVSIESKGIFGKLKQLLQKRL